MWGLKPRFEEDILEKRTIWERGQRKEMEREVDPGVSNYDC